MKGLVLVATFTAAITMIGDSTAQPSPNRIIGYYTAWSIYARNYHVTNIPAAMVTHINYAFANVQGGKAVLGDPWADLQNFQKLQTLKKGHSHVKTLLSLGGWTWSGNFSDAVLTPTSRQTFAASCVNLMVAHGFDGVDIDWEYPVSGGLPSNKTRPQDKQNFTLFLAELRSQLDAEGKKNNTYYLATIAAPANPAIIQNIEVSKIHPYLDWVNIMTYDFHGPWTPWNGVTGFNSPLYMDPKNPEPEPARSTFNVAAAVSRYRTLGVPRRKVQIGLAFYGRGFAGVSGGTSGLYAKYTGPASPGTWENGVFDYTDLKRNYINRAGYTSYWHITARVPWLHNPTKRVMISYDDPRAIREKAWFVKAAGIGGAMFWEFSGDRDADLLQEVHRVLKTEPGLRAPARNISIQAPILADLHMEGGTARAGSRYLLAGSLGGTHPGFPLPGGVVPLDFDPFTGFTLAAANTAVFPNTVGTLDKSGTARCGVNFAAVGPLPPSLVGLRISMAGWVLQSPSTINGEATNPVDFFLMP